ncbi:MAG: FHA domain-containing protein, partial [Eubacterium sp.]|nr:FHA domain-containing protein [Eubacterium sp.]
MRITIIRESKLEHFILPELVDGNYWVFYTDKKGKSKELVNVIAKDQYWVMRKNKDVSIINVEGTESFDEVILQNGELYFLNLADERIILYVSSFCDNCLENFDIVSMSQITIGQADTNSIIMKNPLVRGTHARFLPEGDTLLLQSTGNGVYVNNKSILNTSYRLNIGDIIFIYGLKLIYMKSFLAIENPKHQYVIQESSLKLRQVEPANVLEEGEFIDLSELELYTEEDYFYQSPRLRSSIEKKEIKIDAPPSRQDQAKAPWIFTVGPMLTMACTSIMSGFTAIMGLRDIHWVCILTVMSMRICMLLWRTFRVIWRRCG